MGERERAPDPVASVSMYATDSIFLFLKDDNKMSLNGQAVEFFSSS